MHVLFTAQPPPETPGSAQPSLPGRPNPPLQPQNRGGNHIRVVPFEGDPMDDELRKLQGYLAWLKEVPNVRLVDKRTWRTAPVA